MRLWDTLRTMWDLANRVVNVEERMDAIESDWFDVAEKMKTREDRIAKRLYRDAKRSIEESTPDLEATARIPDAPKARAGASVIARMLAEKRRIGRA